MSNFFDEGDHAQALNDSDVEELIEAGAVPLSLSGRQVLQIDDMLFVVNELRLFGFSGTMWPGGKVFYDFDSSVTQSNKQKFLDACKVWSDVAGLEFTQRKNQPNYLYVKDSNSNSSFVGMIGGKQEIEIYDWDEKFIIAHELGHALGLAHEHERKDRDTYVKINWENISSGNEVNFRKEPTTNYTAYDFESIMHYSKLAFSKNGKPTIEAQPNYKNEENKMGNRAHLTSLDGKGMAQRYGAP